MSVNLTRVSVNLTAISVNLTGISGNLTGVSVNLTQSLWIWQGSLSIWKRSLSIWQGTLSIWQGSLLIWQKSLWIWQGHMKKIMTSQYAATRSRKTKPCKNPTCAGTATSYNQNHTWERSYSRQNSMTSVPPTMTWRLARVLRNDDMSLDCDFFFFLTSLYHDLQLCLQRRQRTLPFRGFAQRLTPPNRLPPL